VLFLNELRFRENAPLNLRIPLTKTEVPAVRAGLGQTGMFEGVDYRGAPVIAAVRSVPDSPWSLVARMNTLEVYAPARERLWLMATFAGFLLFGSAVAMSFIWRQRSAQYRESMLPEQYRIEELLRSNVELEQFSYAVSHDMRQPLRVISSYLQLLEISLADQLDSGKRGYFNFAIDGAKARAASFVSCYLCRRRRQYPQ